MTDGASDTVHNEIPELSDGKDIAGSLQMYAHRQPTYPSLFSRWFVASKPTCNLHSRIEAP